MFGLKEHRIQHRKEAVLAIKYCEAVLFRGGTLKELTRLQDLSATSLEDQIAFYKNLHESTSRTNADGQPCRGALDEALFRGACVHKLLPKVASYARDRAEGGRGCADAEEPLAACALPLLVQIVEMLDKDENDALGKYAQAAEKRVVKGIVEALETVLVIKDPFIRFEALKRVDALAPLLTENYVNRKLFDALLLGFGDKNDERSPVDIDGHAGR